MNPTTQNQQPLAGQAAHTPTPWRVTQAANSAFISGHDWAHFAEVVTALDNEGRREESEEGSANAAFIVTACNAYASNQSEIARLKSRNAELLGALRGMCVQYETTQTNYGQSSRYRAARQAIQRAEEGGK